MRRSTGWFAGAWPPILSAAVGPTSPPETSVIDRATSAVGPGDATEAVRHHAAAQHGRRRPGWFAGVWPPILSAAVGPTSPPETSVIDRATSAVGPGAATEAVRHHAAARHGVVCWRLAADPERCSRPYLATRNVSDRSSNIGCRARRRYGGGAAPRCGAAQGGLLAPGRRS